MPKTMIVIPARYASTRFPGKPLSPLKGATGIAKPLVQRTWEAAKKVRGVDRVVVATDDDRIVLECARFGAEVIMTPESCGNGTERCAWVASQCPEYDLFINFQGDAPLTPPGFCEALIGAFEDDAVQVATPALRCTGDALYRLKNDRRNGRIGGTTVVFNHSADALYFSKEVLPHTSDEPSKVVQFPVFHHVGLYGYRKSALESYLTMKRGPLETFEGLEQLRFLENGEGIRCVEVEERGDFWELNNPSDTEIIEQVLTEQGVV